MILASNGAGQSIQVSHCDPLQAEKQSGLSILPVLADCPAVRDAGHRHFVVSLLAMMVTLLDSLGVRRNCRTTLSPYFTGFPSPSRNWISPYPSERIPSSILLRSPITTQTRLSGWRTFFAASVTFGSVRSRTFCGYVVQ